jgi:hypothetical protein
LPWSYVVRAPDMLGFLPAWKQLLAIEVVLVFGREGF